MYLRPVHIAQLFRTLERRHASCQAPPGAAEPGASDRRSQSKLVSRFLCLLQGLGACTNHNSSCCCWPSSNGSAPQTSSLSAVAGICHMCGLAPAPNLPHLEHGVVASRHSLRNYRRQGPRCLRSHRARFHACPSFQKHGAMISSSVRLDCLNRAVGIENKHA
jgi:hypothetical protein